MQPETKYALLGRDRIAYQTIGQGPIDLVLTPGSFGNLDLEWEDPDAARFYLRLSSFSRVIRFDRRGAGASDPLPLHQLPPWESYVEEIDAVMDAAGSERGAIMGLFDAGPAAALFAATNPERTSALILGQTTAKWVATDDYPIGIPPEVAEQVVSFMEEAHGSDAQVPALVPSRAADDRFRRWFAKLMRGVASPGRIQPYAQSILALDARPILPLVQAPTLVLHRANLAMMPIEHGRYLAEHIPRARFVELPGSDFPIMWEYPEVALDAIQEFLTGVRPLVQPDRVLASVLFTDIVGSTVRARELGDRRWRELLDLHDRVAVRHVEDSRGRLVKRTGDGVLATFEGPGRGIRSAIAFRDEMRQIGVEIRAGLHTGEVELRGDDIGGMAVHIAARVMAEATPGEVLVSRTVRDLIVGSDIELEERGTHRLKGVEGDWVLFAVVGS